MKKIMFLTIAIFSITAIFLMGAMSVMAIIGDYEKVKDVDKINSKKVCKELVKRDMLPEDTNCNDYKDKDIEGSKLSIIEVDPENFEQNVYIVRFEE